MGIICNIKEERKRLPTIMLNCFFFMLLIIFLKFGLKENESWLMKISYIASWNAKCMCNRLMTKIKRISYDEWWFMTLL